MSTSEQKAPAPVNPKQHQQQNQPAQGFRKRPVMTHDHALPKDNKKH